MLSSLLDFTTRKAMPEQLEINPCFARAFDLLQNSRKHLFITGKAGTGKSTLLKYCAANCRKNIVVLAPTGVAALNVGGQTIHRFFNFPINVTPEQIENFKITPRVKRIYKCLETIIIDEISMLRADILDCIDVFLRLYGPDSVQPFGGVQMVFIGDLHQLPPVVSGTEQEAFSRRYPSPYFFDADVFRRIEIETIELVKIYRQKDRSFIELLGRIRSNNLTDEDLHNLNLCCRPPEKDNGFVIHLATTNRLADEINKSRLDALEGRASLSQAVIDGSFASEYYPAAEILELKPGAQIMFLNNDAKKRWVNGTLGKIEDIRLNEDKIRFLRIRLENSGKIVDVFPYTWEIYKYSLVGKEIVSDIAGSFTQYPLRLAWAVTIHKSQGKTFDHILLDVGSGTFAPGQLYVALSRCTSLNGIHLVKPLQKRHVLTDERINLFMRRCLVPVIPPVDKAALFEQAALRRQKLKIEYRRQDGQVSHRIIVPLRIKGENLLAFCTQRQEQRSFNLERILRITPFYE